MLEANEKFKFAIPVCAGAGYWKQHMSLRLRNFCFTINNPRNSPIELGLKLNEYAKYLVFQKEKGENGTEHYQGYAELEKQTRFGTVKQWFQPDVPHLEPRRGSAKQASDYCQKEESRISGPYEYGVLSAQGKRQDIVEFKSAIQSGKSTKELLEEFAMQVAKFPKFIQTVRATVNQPRRLDLQVLCYYGDTGTGKTRKAYDENEDMYAVPFHQGQTWWFDGYDGEEVVLLDEFSGEMPLVQLLRFLDIYPLQIPVKGSFVYLNAKKIIITSNTHPERWYDWTKHSEERKDAFFRRFHTIDEFRKETESFWVPTPRDPNVDPRDINVPGGRWYDPECFMDE